MKILITGSMGFIGSKLYDRLGQIALTSTDKTEADEVFPLKSDLLSWDDLSKEIAEVQPDAVVHLAAMTEVEKSFYDPSRFSSVNYVGTVNLIESLRMIADKTGKFPHFFFASTMEVYGWNSINDWIINVREQDLISEIKQYRFAVRDEEKKWASWTEWAFDEETPCAPNAPYAVAKLACEEYIKYAHRVYGMPYTIVRQTNAYGRTNNNFFVTERIITEMLKGMEANLGDPRPYRNFIHIDDVIRFWITALHRPEAVNQTFCMGPDEPWRISEWAFEIAKLIGWGGVINWNTRPHRPGEIFYLNSTGAKAEGLLGWKPTISPVEGLTKTIKHWKRVLCV